MHYFDIWADFAKKVSQFVIFLNKWGYNKMNLFAFYLIDICTKI
jgi:hypothetical protein